MGFSIYKCFVTVVIIKIKIIIYINVIICELFNFFCLVNVGLVDIFCYMYRLRYFMVLYEFGDGS